MMIQGVIDPLQKPVTLTRTDRLGDTGWQEQIRCIPIRLLVGVFPFDFPFDFPFERAGYGPPSRMGPLEQSPFRP